MYEISRLNLSHRRTRRKRAIYRSAIANLHRGPPLLGVQAAKSQIENLHYLIRASLPLHCLLCERKYDVSKVEQLIAIMRV